MEQLIKLQFGELKRHQKVHFDKYRARIERIELWGAILWIVLIILQILNLFK